MHEIKVGYLVSYDYKLLKNSIPTVYDKADVIALAIDVNYKTWNGSNFKIEKEFFDWIKDFDHDHKIQIYFDEFYVPNFSPMECETRERNLLAKYMGTGGWHIQVDSDEYFLDFNEFINELKNILPKKNQNVCIYTKFITIFKQIEEGFLLINRNEYVPLATNNPDYSFARTNRNSVRLNLNTKVLHQSWARTNNEVKQKLNNWGHTKDFNTDSFFNLWNAIDRYNYKFITDFHPLSRGMWGKLELVEKATITELINELNNSHIGVVHNSKLNLLKKLYQSFTPPIFQRLVKKLIPLKSFLYLSLILLFSSFLFPY